jgi:hypothetical protein
MGVALVTSEDKRRRAARPWPGARGAASEISAESLGPAREFLEAAGAIDTREKQHSRIRVVVIFRQNFSA